MAWEKYGWIRKFLTLFFVWLYFCVIFSFCVGLIDNAIINLLLSQGYPQKEVYTVWRFYWFVLEVLKALFGRT
jgi:multisubunit Na+/H+ antiporter MnhE subunit